MNDTKAHQLLEALGLTIVKEGAARRYPCGEPGPKASFRYWCTFTEGRLKFGVQQNPKQELAVELQHRLMANGFLLTPAKTEGFVWLDREPGSSVDIARAAMGKLRELV